MLHRLSVVALSIATSAACQSPRFSSTDQSAPLGSQYVQLADIDSDGDLDLLARDSALSARNDGTGRFTAGFSTVLFGLANGAWTGSAQVWINADFNNDGLVDRAFAPSPGNQIYVVYSTTGGPPAGTTILTIPGSYAARYVEAADIDGDGDVDLIAGGHQPTGSGGAVPGPIAPRVFLNAGTSLSTTAVTMGLWSAIGLGGRAADLDGDGTTEWITVAASGASTVLGVQTRVGASFAAPATVTVAESGLPGRRPAVGDFDGDGLKDVAFDLATRIAVLRKLPGATAFAAPAFVDHGAYALNTGSSPPIVDPSGCAAANFDADPADELAVVGPTGLALYSLAGSTPVQESASPFVLGSDAAAGDLDADGDVDLAVLQGNPASGFRTSVLFNVGDGTFVDPSAAPDAPGTYAKFAVGDVDADGDADLLGYGWTETGGGAPFVALNAGDGTFGPTTAAPCPSCPPMPGFAFGILFQQPFVRAFDADGDGDADLWYSPNDGGSATTAYLLRNDGPAGFVAEFSYTGGNTTGTEVGADAADFDGDGNRDLVVASNVGGARVYLRTPGGFVPQPLLPVTGGPSRAFASDLDSDGDPDVLVATAPSVSGGPVASVFLNNGGSLTALAQTYALTNANATFADMNGDGLADLVSGPGYRRRTGPGTFAQPTDATLPTNSFSPSVALDVDGDSDVDIVSATGHVIVNNGVGGLSVAGIVPTDWPALGAFVGADFDRDGDGDLLMRGPAILSAQARRFEIARPLRPGYVARFELSGPANGAWLTAACAEPFTFTPLATPWGRLAIDPFCAVVLGAGSLDASGDAFLEAAIGAAAGAALIGSGFTFQAVVDGPAGPRLTASRRWTIAAF